MRKNLILILAICLCLTTCKFTDYGDETGDFEFIEQGSAPAGVSNIRNALLRYPYLYCADSNGSLSVYNVSTPTYPYLVSTRPLPGLSQPIRRIEYNNYHDNLYLAAGTGGVYIVNVSNPANPVYVTSYQYINAYDISYYNHYLAVTDTNGFRLFYTNSASTLSEEDSYEFFINKQPQKLLLTYYWAFVFTSYTLEIFDVTNTRNIVWEKSIELNSPFIDFTQITDSYLAAITQNNIQIFDITSPLNISLAKYYDINRSPVMMRYYNSNLYISWTDRSLTINRVYGINNISEVSRKVFDHRVADVEFYSDYIYLSNEEDGIKIYRIML